MSENKKIEELGEFGLISHLNKNIKTQQKSTIKGIGDDAAVIKKDDKNSFVISTDMLIDGVHFDLTYMPLKYLGYKAVVINLSDIYAMNASPTQITVSIAFSNRFSLQNIEELYEGINAACNNYNTDLVGGDTSTAVKGLTISITAVGVAENDKITYRSSAKENDLICMTGNVGASFVGLKLLQREKKVFENDSKNFEVDFNDAKYIIERHLKPEPRADLIKFFAKNQIQPTTMIDISDGLSSELHHICKQSEVACTIYEDKINIHSETKKIAEKLNLEPLVAALNGGEDYEMLFTIKMENYEKVKNNDLFSVIGHITDKKQGLNIVTNSENFLPLKAQGWNAFDN